MSNSLPRVCYCLHLHPGQKFGSMEEQIVILAREFEEQGSLFLPLFVCKPQDGALAQFHSRGVAAECLDLDRFSCTRLFDLNRLLKKNRIDVIHWNFASPLGNIYVWGLSVMQPRLRHWMTDHNSRLLPLKPPSRLRSFLKRGLLTRYSRVVCVSEYVKQQLENQNAWSNLTCLTHFVNTERFKPDAETRRAVRERMGVGGRFVALIIGQLIEEKGIEVAIRALAQLPERVVVWLIGAGNNEAHLRALVAELGLENRVTFLGLQRDCESFLQAADCFVCPSTWAEAAGLVNLEAQACGLPVVASRIGGIPEYVEEMRSGLLFESGNHDELAKCIRRFVDDPALRLQFAERARALALERYSPGARVPEILDLYRREKRHG